MNRIEMSSLKVGDQVGCAAFGNWGDIHNAFFAKVVRVSKTGQVTVERGGASKGEQYRFTKNGDQIGGGYRGHSILDPKDLQERIDRERARRETNRRAIELIKEIGSHRTGAGDYNFDEEARGKLLALVAQL